MRRDVDWMGIRRILTFDGQFVGELHHVNRKGKELEEGKRVDFCRE